MTSKKSAVTINIGDVIKNQYEITRRLGQGGFGAVYEVLDKKNNDLPYAIKVELKRPDSDEPGLELEIGVLKKMQNCPQIVRYVDDGRIGPYRYIIMQLAGRNLSDLRKSCPENCFTLSTAIRISLQSMDAIEALHLAAMLHRDIKPANFAIGRGKECKNVYVLDFGLVRRYRTKDGAIRPARQRAGFRGTVKYASVNAHNNVDLGRHDDLWSWIYMAIELVKGGLPWRHETNKASVGINKASAKDKLLKDMDDDYRKIYESLEKLTYTDDPPYATYRQSLNHLMKKKKLTGNEPLDWEEHGKYFVETNQVQQQPFEKAYAAKKDLVQEKLEGEGADDAQDAV